MLRRVHPRPPRRLLRGARPARRAGAGGGRRPTAPGSAPTSAATGSRATWWCCRTGSTTDASTRSPPSRSPRPRPPAGSTSITCAAGRPWRCPCRPPRSTCDGTSGRTAWRRSCSAIDPTGRATSRRPRFEVGGAAYAVTVRTTHGAGSAPLTCQAVHQRPASRATSCVGHRAPDALETRFLVLCERCRSTPPTQLADRRFARMRPFGGRRLRRRRPARPAARTALAGARADASALLRFRHRFVPTMHRRYGDVFTVRTIPRGRPLVLFTRPGAREGDLRRRPRGLPRGQGQRHPRPDHGRALAAAPGRRRAQAGAQAADAGVQRARPARLRRPGHRARRRPRSPAGATARRSGRWTG